MDRPLPPPNELLGLIAEATFESVGLNFVVAAGRIITASWGAIGVFVSEANREDHGAGRVFITPAVEFRRAELPQWIEARGLPWFPPAPHTKFSATLASLSGDVLLSRLQATAVFSIRLESRSTSQFEYLGLIDGEEWSEERQRSVEALLHLIAARTAAELERERLAQAAAARARAMRHITDSLSDGVLIWSAGAPWTLEYANKAALDLSGQTAGDLRNDASGLISRLTSLPRAHGSGDADYTGELSIVRGDGASIDIAVSILVVGSPDSAPTYYCVIRPAGSTEQLALAPPEQSIPAIMGGAKTSIILFRGGKVTLMNQQAKETFGSASADEVAATRIVVRSGGREVSMPLHHCIRQLERQSYAERIIRMTGKRGGERLLELRSHTVADSGEPRVVVVIRDITAKEQRIAALEERIKANESVLRSLPLGLIAIDREGIVVWVNDRWASERQRTGDELRWLLDLKRGDNFISACHHAANAGVVLARDLSIGAASVLNASADGYGTEYPPRGARADGDGRSFIAFVTPLAEDRGALIGIAETSPLTQRVRDAQGEAARALSLLASLPEQVARLNLNGDIVQVIGPAQRAPGVALLPNAPFRRNIREVMPDEEAQQLLEAAHESVQRNQPIVVTLRVMHQDAERQYEARLLPLDEGVLLTLLDRTSEQRAPAGRDSEEVTTRLRRRNPYDLTFREAAVLEFMAEGVSDKEIALNLGISVFTVNKHVSKILHKMGAASRTEASMRAVRELLINR